MTEYHGLARLRKMRELRGLGDAVAMVAQPIAKAIDKHLGTDIQNCKGCHQRQEDWNNAIPFHREG